MRRTALAIQVLALQVLALLVSVGGFPGPSRADESDIRRATQLKSGYLLNFVKFVEWPQSAPGEPLTICFVGAESMFATLAAGIGDKHIGTRPLAVRQIDETGKTDGCNALYVEDKYALTMQFASREPRLPMLTVSDAKDFAHNGGIIELFTDANHLRFIINVDNAHLAGLRISSNLLQLAAAVEQGKPP